MEEVDVSTKPDGDAPLEEEEALVVALFKGIAPASPRPGQQEPPIAKRFKAVEQQLLEAERKFLGSSEVSTEGVQLQDVASRFKSHEMPPKPSPESAYVSGLVESTVQDAVNTASPVMIGHMTSSLPYYARPLSRLITTMNQNSVKTETANTVTFLERQALAELHRQMFRREDEFYEKYAQDPTCALGVLTSGGTVANITGLWVARNRAIPGIDELGMIEAIRRLPGNGGKGFVCIGSELLHYSMTKALDLLGLGSSSLVRVPVDEGFRAPVAGVREAARKAQTEGKVVLAIIGLAGSTEAGSFDDLDGLADVANEFNAHFHVDAAWGGPAIFSKSLAGRLRGIERADTVTMDGHKQLYVPMGCGLLFFREPDLSRVVRKTAGYIIRSDSHDLGKFTLEGSRPANAVHLHSNLHILGVRGYELLVDRSARMTNYMADKVRESSDFELLVDPPQANILLYRAVPDKKYQTEPSSAEENAQIDTLNIKLQETQRLRGKTFVSRTTIRSPLARHGGARIVALRVVIANPLTYEDDVDRVLQDQREILRSFDGKAGSSTAQASSPSFKTASAAASRESAGAASSTAKAVDDDEPNHVPRNASYWSKVWEGMDDTARALFHDSQEQFIGSLISPELQVEDGLFKDPKYEKHLTFWGV